MELLEALALPPEGWTCLVGGGGKSSLMLRLVKERIGRGLPALAATTTHIGVEQGRAAGPLVGTLEELEAARKAGLTACAAGIEPETGKLIAPPPEVVERGLTLILSTHDRALAQDYADILYELKEGSLYEVAQSRL